MRKADPEMCSDFVGAPLVVGDFVARSMYSGHILYLIKRIRYKCPTSRPTPNGGYIVCDLELVNKNINVVHKVTKIPEELCYVDRNRAVLYKFSV